MHQKNSNGSNFKIGSEPPQRGFFMEMLIHLRISIIATVVMAIICCAIYPAIVWGLAQALFHHKANGSLVAKDGSPTDDDSKAVGSLLLGQSFSDEKYFHPRPSAASYDPTQSQGSNLGPLSMKLLNGTTKPSTQPAAAPATQTATTAPASAPVVAVTQPSTQPAVVVDYDGIKLRTVLYAQENSIDVVDASQPLKSFQDAQGNYDQVKLIMAFNDSSNPLTFKTAQPIPPDAVTASASGLDPHISVDNATIQAKRIAPLRKISLEKVKELIGQCTDGPDLGLFGDPAVNVLKLNIALDNLK
jgi:potassium-transporting ATPase KdpC subunit